MGFYLLLGTQISPPPKEEPDLLLQFPCSFHVVEGRQSVDLTKGQKPGEEFTNTSQVSSFKKTGEVKNPK